MPTPDLYFAWSRAPKISSFDVFSVGIIVWYETATGDIVENKGQKELVAVTDSSMTRLMTAQVAEGVTKGLEAAGVDEDTSEGLGALSGGAVGGGVAAGTAIGGAALMGAEIGELGGPLGVAAGAGVGAVVGTAGWLIGKLF